MEVLEAITSRRSVFKFKPDPVPHDVIEKILEFGIFAPNHKLTEPWRFTVVGEGTKGILAERYREIQIEKAADHVDAENKARIGEAGFQKLMSKPTIIAVSCIQDGDEQQRREDYAAACCAMMNVQLVAWEMGVGMQWSTGKITMEENTYRMLNIDQEHEYLIGFFYTGYPAEIGKPKRNPLHEVLRWTP